MMGWGQDEKKLFCAQPRRAAQFFFRGSLELEKLHWTKIRQFLTNEEHL